MLVQSYRYDVLKQPSGAARQVDGKLKKTTFNSSKKQGAKQMADTLITQIRTSSGRQEI